jgi:multiple sugar transport system substrate-binding protein
VSLSILAWDHPRATAPLAACSQAWARLTGEPLTIATRSLRSFGDDVPRAGNHDLVLIDHPHVGRAADDGAILALDDLLDDRQLALLAADSAGLSHSSYQYGGHHWAAAVDASCQALAMPRPALERSRPPETWNDVLALARRYPAQVALPLQPAHAISALLSLIATRGPIARASGLAGDRVLGWAVGTLAEVAAAGPAEAFGWEPPDVLTRLAQNELICVPLVYAYTGYDVAWSSAPAAVPAGRPGSILGGVGAAVLAGSPDPPAAARLAAWLGSPDVQLELVLGSGGQPATLSAWSSPSADPMYAAVLPTLESGRLRPRDPWWPGFQRASGELLARELEAGAEPGEIARQLAGLYHDHREGTP